MVISGNSQTMDTLDPSKFQEFKHAAAGHAGVMSDETGELFIKPCTQAEVEFYQETMLYHPDVYDFMPTFMGSLRQSQGVPSGLQIQDSAFQTDNLHEGTSASGDTVLAATASVGPVPDPPTSSVYGKELAADTAVVLGNLEYGFARPNVLDLKLGARLHADDTDPAKIARLEKVASETTSGSLNFRIAGMRVWDGQKFEIFDKFYGRTLTPNSVNEGFAKFFSGLLLGKKHEENAKRVLQALQADVRSIRQCLERTESRMYSASLLLVYEGDRETMAEKLTRLLSNIPEEDPKQTLRKDSDSHETLFIAPRIHGGSHATQNERDEDEDEKEDDDEADDDEDEGGYETVYRVKLIDFAHSAWTPSKGPDDNVIKGCRNIENQLNLVLDRLG